MNYFDKFKEIFNKKFQKNSLSNLFVILIVGVIILIATSTFTGDKQDDSADSIDINTKSSMDSKQTISQDYEMIIEKKLETILCKINGVGEVKAMVILEDSEEKIPAINTTNVIEQTDEKDAQGGIRTVTREDVTKQMVVSNNSGKEELVIIKETKPKVRGVIIVAEGAKDIFIKEKLYSAVKTVLGISGNKVEIYSSN